MADTFDFSTMGDIFEQLGYGGARTGADIVSLLGKRHDTDISAEERAKWGERIQSLVDLTRTDVGKLPELFSTLTGQAQETARIGRERIGESFLGERGGLQRAALGQTQQFQRGQARAGFAGGGALRREREVGRRTVGEMFENLLGRRRTGLGGVQAGLERGLFGAEERIGTEESGLMANLLSGIQNLEAAMERGEVFGRDEVDETAEGSLPDWGDFVAYQNAGGKLSYNDWINAGRPPPGRGQVGRDQLDGGQNYGGEDVLDDVKIDRPIGADYADYDDYADAGGSLSFEDWIDANRPRAGR